MTTPESTAAPSPTTPVPPPTVVVDDRDPARLAVAKRLATGGDVVRVQPTADRRDPYRLAARAGRRPGDMVLVAPRVRGPRRCTPAAVVGASPVGIVLADHHDHVMPEVAAPDPEAPWVVAAMGKDVFLAATEPWQARLVAGGRRAIDLRADRARRSDLLAGLAAGPRLVLYAGHGRARGWAGYQALRWHHFGRTVPTSGTGRATDPVTDGDASDSDGATSVRACGLVMAFACGTLSRPRGIWPFGAQLVAAGRARAYLAPASRVVTAQARQLGDIVVDLLATTRPATAGALVTAIEKAVEDQPAAAGAWATFRLVGDPTTRIW